MLAGRRAWAPAAHARRRHPARRSDADLQHGHHLVGEARGHVLAIARPAHLRAPRLSAPRRHGDGAHTDTGASLGERGARLKDAARAPVRAHERAVAHAPHVQVLVERAAGQQLAVGREGDRVHGLRVLRQREDARACLRVPQPARPKQALEGCLCGGKLGALRCYVAFGPCGSESTFAYLWLLATQQQRRSSAYCQWQHAGAIQQQRRSRPFCQ